MKMNVHFHNVSRPKDVQTLMECTFKDTLLDLCNGVETAFHLRSQFKAVPHKPSLDWPRFYRVAFKIATDTANLSSKEKERILPVIEFI